MVSNGLATLQGQQIAVPIPSGNLLPGKVEGERIVITGRFLAE